jgi:hypothetical protein
MKALADSLIGIDLIIACNVVADPKCAIEALDGGAPGSVLAFAGG